MRVRSQISLLGIILISVILSCCASIQKHTGPTSSWDEIHAGTPTHIDLTQQVSSSEMSQANEAMREDFEKFAKGQLSLAKLQASHAKFLSVYSPVHAYSQIVRPNLELMIPPQTEVKIPFKWFCLNSDKAVPSEHEYVEWVKGDPGIPYYSKILHYADAHRDQGSIIQSLLWGLQHKVPYSAFDDDKKAILNEIDPNAATKLLASDLTKSLKESLLSKARDLAGRTTVGEAVENTLSHYQNYEVQLQDLLKRRSSLMPVHSGEPQLIFEDPLFADTHYNGFGAMAVSFYNTGAMPHRLDLSRFYLSPARWDVQRQALIPELLSDEQLNMLDKMEATEQEVKPYITPVEKPRPTSIGDPVPPQESSKPNIFPAPPKEKSPVIGDPIPPREPPRPYTNDAALPSQKTSNEIVLGHYPEYLALADIRNARRFNVPPEVWEKMNDDERWEANRKFLDRAINRNSKIILSTPKSKAKDGSSYARELKYMEEHGYKLSTDGKSLVRD